MLLKLLLALGIAIVAALYVDWDEKKENKKRKGHDHWNDPDNW